MPVLLSQAYIELALTGVALGWSVAWPPGPVNMEIVRRGSVSGFWSGFSICIGAVSGDALWAFIVFSGTGLLSSVIAVSDTLKIVSLLLLMGLATYYFFSGSRDMIRWHQGELTAHLGHIESSRGGFILGFFLSLTSPWSIAFWLGVSGILTSTMQQASFQATLIISIIIGALAWGLLLCLATQPLLPLLKKTIWHASTKFVTAAFLGFIVIVQVAG